MLDKRLDLMENSANGQIAGVRLVLMENIHFSYSALSFSFSLCRSALYVGVGYLLCRLLHWRRRITGVNIGNIRQTKQVH